MDYWRAIRFPVDDAGWIAKVIIGSVIGLIPIVNFAQQGYALEIIRRVALGDEEELPVWDRFGTYLLKGLGLATAILIYMLPGLLLIVLGLALSGGSEIIAISFVLVVAGYGLLVAVLFPAAMTHYALAGYWTALFDVGRILRMAGDRAGSYVILLVVTLVFGVVAGMVGGIALFVGSLVASFWTVLVLGHLLGQLAGFPLGTAR